MEIVLLIALVIFAIIALALSPLARMNGDASQAETRARAGDAGADRQFKRWLNRQWTALGRERYGSRSTERGGELGEDRQVGVQRHPIQSTDSERS